MPPKRQTFILTLEPSTELLILFHPESVKIIAVIKTMYTYIKLHMIDGKWLL